jgi:hypothetical protein
MTTQEDLELKNRRGNELSVLKKYGLRWAVLAAWQDDLTNREAELEPELFKKLEASRAKIASGCFTSCEVGCDLQEIESLLTSVDTSLPKPALNRWLKLLGLVMKDDVDVEHLLGVPAVNFRYNDCALRPCSCGR